jgi:hypothetical protein
MDMNKAIKFISKIMTLVMVLGLLVTPNSEVQAASTATVTKAVHLYVGTCDDNAISVEFTKQWDHIENLKTSSKNLKAKIVGVNLYNDNVKAPYNAKIGLYASKAGTYSVTFDINDSDDEKVSSHSVKVYVNEELAVKSVTFSGGEMYHITTKTKGKISVTMNKGYKLKKIVVETYDQSGNTVSKTVKNNSNITLGTYPYSYESGEMYGDYYNLSTSIMVPTFITIYYTDKYTKAQAYETKAVYRVAE